MENGKSSAIAMEDDRPGNAPTSTPASVPSPINPRTNGSANAETAKSKPVGLSVPRDQRERYQYPVLDHIFIELEENALTSCITGT